MHKIGQSILDFINMFPIEILKAPRASISNQEANALYEIWKHDRDEYGRSVVPENVDAMIVASLTSKGMIKSHPIPLLSKSVVEITKKGKEVVKKIILFSEKSVFDKDPINIDYELINQKMLSAQSKSTKTASMNWMQSLSDGN